MLLKAPARSTPAPGGPKWSCTDSDSVHAVADLLDKVRLEQEVTDVVKCRLQHATSGSLDDRIMGRQTIGAASR